MHGVACGLLDGIVDLSSYEDETRESQARVAAMRFLAVLTLDKDIASAAVDCEVRLFDVVD